MHQQPQRPPGFSGMFWPVILLGLIGYAICRLLFGSWLSGITFLLSLFSFFTLMAWWHESLAPLEARFGLMATVQTFQDWFQPSCLTLPVGFLFLIFMIVTALSF